MMLSGRKIDLALEARELAGAGLPAEGVRLREKTLLGWPLTRVEIVSPAGEQALGRPQGTYLTLTLPQLPRGREEMLRAAKATAAMLESLLPAQGPVLVTGLGNRQITPDALGPRTVEQLLVTRHLTKHLPKAFGALRPVAALAAGVAGSTGMESGELLQAAAAAIHPRCLIAVDALAARRQERVCRTIQSSDTGIVPGSGVGNARMALTQESLGLPVIAVGVPTVVEAATLCLDLLEEAGGEKNLSFDPFLFRKEGAEWFLTSRGIHGEVEALARILGFGISLALHKGLTPEEIEDWMA